ATQLMARAVLREAGPLTLDEVLARVTARGPVASKNPRQAVRNALANDPLCRSTGDGRYIYLPTFMRGACLRVVLPAAAPEHGRLAVGSEVWAFLWSQSRWGEPGP